MSAPTPKPTYLKVFPESLPDELTRLCQSALKNDPVSASKNDPLKIKKDGNSLRLCASGHRRELKGLAGARMGQSVARRSGSKPLERIGTAMVIPGF